MNKTATILSREEALALPLAERPLNYRLSSEMYHDIWAAIGDASTCGNDAERAGDIATKLCLRVAEELEKQSASRDAEAWRKLIEEMGAFEDDSFTKIEITGDDATRTWHVKIGKQTGWGNSIMEALFNAAKG